MFEYRVTKYDPAHRDSAGRYLLDEWTAFSDVGKTVALAEYEAVERAYIDVALAFMTEAGIADLFVANLENAKRVTLPFAAGAKLSHPQLRVAFQLVLREQCWCRFLHDTIAFVHFGWDYYMYVATPRDCPNAKQLASDRALFVESCPSPYPTLKTIKLAPIPSATPELAAELKAEFRWLSLPPDILRMLRGDTPINVVEHLRPQYVQEFTNKLDSLGLTYLVTDDD